jgi:hypothetical protein
MKKLLIILVAVLIVGIATTNPGPTVDITVTCQDGYKYTVINGEVKSVKRDGYTGSKVPCFEVENK